VGEVDLITQSCFAMEIRESAKLILGKKDDTRGKVGGQVLTSLNLSSLVIDHLCDQANRKNTAVACFYFDFAAQKRTVIDEYAGSLAKTGCGRAARGPGGNSEGL